ncbi:MAG: hypothetical protein ACRDTE_25485, partial [Pseudonocardiaceae bacterium]
RQTRKPRTNTQEQSRRHDGPRHANPSRSTSMIDLRLSLVRKKEWIHKSHDVRLIAVGAEFFAVGIHTNDPEALIDWRANYGALSYSRTEIPARVEKGVRAFMKSSGLNFSALDFVVTPDGRWIFLESNSGGQYGWLTPTLGTSVSDAISTLLAHGEPQ